MTDERDIASDLQAIADGRMLLNVRHGIALPAGMITRAAAEIERLRAELAKARNAALEEAAKLVELPISLPEIMDMDGLDSLASAIRNLKGTPNAD